MARLKLNMLFSRSNAARSRLGTLAKVLSVLSVILVCALLALAHSASILVVNHPKPADVIVVATTEGYYDDVYYYNAKRLLEARYGDVLLLPADGSGDPGHTEADQARAFVAQTAGAMRGKIFVCPVGDDEFQGLRQCLERLHARKVLMVAPAPESRRCFITYKDHLPQYSWSVAAVEAPKAFGKRWWSNRRWAKAYVEGLQRLIYAEVGQLE